MCVFCIDAGEKACKEKAHSHCAYLKTQCTVHGWEALSVCVKCKNNQKRHTMNGSAHAQVSTKNECQNECKLGLEHIALFFLISEFSPFCVSEAMTSSAPTRNISVVPACGTNSRGCVGGLLLPHQHRCTNGTCHITLHRQLVKNPL